MATKFVDLSSVIAKTDFDYEDFIFDLKFPGIIVNNDSVSKYARICRELSEPIDNFKYVRNWHQNEQCIVIPTCISPGAIAGQLSKFGEDFTFVPEVPVKISIENFNIRDLLRAVTGENFKNVRAFEVVGHVAHLNLEESSGPIKHKIGWLFIVIGKLILLKNHAIKTVINKFKNVTNAFRKLDYEIIAGEPNLNVIVRENSCVFNFDLSEVYWNSRLETVHKYISDSIPIESLVLDVTCGVGPFTIPLAKNRSCYIIANDLNPECIKYLKQNAISNGVDRYVSVSCLDAHDFITSTFKHVSDGNALISMSENIFANAVTNSLYVIVNLPNQSLTFIPTIKRAIAMSGSNMNIIVYCLFFYKGSELLWPQIDSYAEEYLQGWCIQERKCFRKVSPNKFYILYVVKT